jgi:hypothetical protein
MKAFAGSSVSLVIVFLGAAVVFFFIGVCVVAAVGEPVPTQLWGAGGAIIGALVGVLLPSPGRGATSAASTAAADAAHSAAVQAATNAGAQQPQIPEVQTAVSQALDSVRGARAQIHGINARLTQGSPPAAAAATAAQTTRLSLQSLVDQALPAVRQAQSDVKASRSLPADQRANKATALKAASARYAVLQAAATAATNQTDDATKAGVTAAKTVTKPQIQAVSILGVLFVALLVAGIVLEVFVNAKTHPNAADAGKTVLAIATSAGAALVALFAPEPQHPAAGITTGAPPAKS